MSTYHSVLIHRNSVIMFFGCLYPCSLHWTSSVCDSVHATHPHTASLSASVGSFFYIYSSVSARMHAHTPLLYMHARSHLSLHTNICTNRYSFFVFFLHTYLCSQLQTHASSPTLKSTATTLSLCLCWPPLCVLSHSPPYCQHPYILY